MSDAHVAKRAQRFTAILAEKFIKDELDKGNLENFFEEAIGALPDGNLKTELKTNTLNYLKEYKLQVSLSHPQDGSEKGYIYNLFVKNGHKVNEELMNALPVERQKKVYTCLLAQRADKITNEDAMEKKVQKCLVEDEQEKLPWLKNIHLLCSLLIAKCEAKVLQKTMKLFHKNLLNSVETCISKKRLKRLERLQTETVQFLYFCHVYHEKIQQSFTKPSYGECVAGILAVYYDMLVAMNSDSTDDAIKMCGRKLTGVTLNLLHNQSQHGLDILLPSSCLSLEVGNVSKKAEEIIIPLARCLLIKPAECHSNDCATYTKYVAAIKHMQSLFPTQLADEIKTADQVAAPVAYLDWIEQNKPEVMDDIPVTKSFHGTAITQFLLKEASAELLENLIDILVDDIKNEDSPLSPVEENSISPEDTKEPAENEEPMFFLDTGGDKKTSKQLKKELGLKGDAKYDDPVEHALDDDENELNLHLDASYEEKENIDTSEDEIMLVDEHEESSSDLVSTTKHVLENLTVDPAESSDPKFPIGNSSDILSNMMETSSDQVLESEHFTALKEKTDDINPSSPKKKNIRRKSVSQSQSPSRSDMHAEQHVTQQSSENPLEETMSENVAKQGSAVFNSEESLVGTSIKSSKYYDPNKTSTPVGKDTVQSDVSINKIADNLSNTIKRNKKLQGSLDTDTGRASPRRLTRGQIPVSEKSNSDTVTNSQGTDTEVIKKASTQNASPGKIAVAVDEEITLQFDDTKCVKRNPRVTQIMADELDESSALRKKSPTENLSKRSLRRRTVAGLEAESSAQDTVTDVPTRSKRRRTMSEVSSISECDPTKSESSESANVKSKRRSVAPSVNEESEVHVSESELSTPAKRGRGRPPGSLNKKKPTATPKSLKEGKPVETDSKDITTNTVLPVSTPIKRRKSSKLSQDAIGTPKADTPSKRVTRGTPRPTPSKK